MQETTPSPNFVSYLQEELLRRCRSNPRYSLRSFARTLEIEPSALSKILHGKRAVTRNTFDLLADRLALSPTQLKQLAPPDKLRRRRAATTGKASNAPEYAEISPEMFEAISDWHHFAILELTAIAGFRPDAKWIARKLGITASQVRIAAERLQAIGFLEIDARGAWNDRSGSVTAARGRFSSAAARKLQTQVLEKSLIALNELPITERDHSTICMAIDSRKLPEAKARIRKFRRELCDFLKGEDPAVLDRVYHLAVSLYPVTSLTPERKSR